MHEEEKNIQFLRDDNKKYNANLFICSNYNDIAADELGYIFSNEEYKKYNNFDSLTRKSSFLFGRYAAKKALSKLYNISKLSDINISNGVFGQPIISHKSLKNIQTSIAHSNNIASAIVFEENHPTAIDVEIIDKSKNQNIEEQLTKYELGLLSNTKTSQEIFNFISWSAKESLAKILKTGFTLPLSVIEIASIENYQNKEFTSTYKNFTQYQTKSYPKNNFIYSLTFPKNSKLLF